MTCLPSSLDELLAVADAAPTDGARGIGDPGRVSRRLEPCAPALLVLADASGNVLFADDFDSREGVALAATLAAELARALANKPLCRVELRGHGSRIGFGVRLPEAAGAGIVGCLLAPAGAWVPPPGDGEASRVVSAALAWAASRTRESDDELRTRVAHLQAEHDTLKNAQTQAVAAAIDEREQRLQQQRRDVARLEAVMNLAADGIVIVNRAGIVESFNEAAGRIFGYDPGEVINHGVSVLIPESHRRHGEAQALTYLCDAAGASAGSTGEVMGQRKDGSVFPLEIAVSEVPLEAGHVWMGIFRDITDRRRLERQLVQAQKMESVGQLAAGIAHEINTPTQYVGDNARFLEDAFRDLAPLLVECRRLSKSKAAGPSPELVAVANSADLDYLLEEIPKAIAQSLEGVDRVARIVHSMKDFSHPGGDAKRAVDLNRALESTLTVCRSEWKYVADAVTDFDPTLPPVTCLAGECNQVFLNLIINAAHAIGEKVAGGSAAKGTITIRTRRDGDWAEIRVADTGTGIPEHARPKIFDPFFTTKEVGRGTGQGLAIAHSVITEKHGGTIHVDTEVGRGTTFVVRLPIAGGPLSPEGTTREEADLVR